jgi:dTDP-4-dehydrorhamnose reductase
MRILLIGADGQLGSDLTHALDGRVAIDLRRATHAELDVCEAASVNAAFEAHTPDLVINTAAYNRVDACEDDPAHALRVNAAGPQLVAQACQRTGARLLHVSTDYVFSGDSVKPWSEPDCTRPVNLYGISKLAGELAVRTTCSASYVVRVSGLFGMAGSRAKGGNFVETMLRMQAEGRQIRVVADQILSPTYTGDLAAKMVELILAEPPFGIYHLTAGGQCSWYMFARAIMDFAGLEANLDAQSSDELKGRAHRPRYSVLANGAAGALGLAPMRLWEDGLRDYLVARGFPPKLSMTTTAKDIQYRCASL